MSFRSSIALGAMTAALVVPAAAFADAGTPHKAKAKKHHHAAAVVAAPQAEEGLNTAAQLQLTQQQLAQVQAQLNDLQAKVAAAPKPVDNTAAVVKAQATADKAAAAAAKASMLSDAVAWAANTKVSGRVFLNASSIVQKNAAGAETEKDGGVNIKRAYLGVDHKFSSVFSGTVLVDFAAAPQAGAGLNGAYIKNAFLDAKFAPALDVKLGAATLPWVGYEEAMTGYRFIEIPFLNAYKVNGQALGQSADWGVHASGEFAGGLVSYNVAAINGAGYKTVQFQTQTVDVEGMVKIKYGPLNAALGGYSGRLGQEVGSSLPTAAYNKNSSRWNLMGAYKGKVGKADVTLTGEYFEARNWGTADLASVTTANKATGYSLTAAIAPVAKWSVFGRYDYLKPNVATAATYGNHVNYYNVGINYAPVSIVNVALAYKHYKAAGTLAAYNDLSSSSATRDEVGVFTEFKF